MNTTDTSELYDRAQSRMADLLKSVKGLQVALPQHWMSDGGAAHDLMLEFEIDVNFAYGSGSKLFIETQDHYGHTRSVAASDHPSKAVALRYAILATAIAHLEFAASIKSAQPIIQPDSVTIFWQHI